MPSVSSDTVGFPASVTAPPDEAKRPSSGYGNGNGGARAGQDAIHTATAGDGRPRHAATASLVARAREGDPEAFGQLYDRYVELIYRYISYRVAAPVVAEDLTSETFLRALRKLGSFTWQGRDFGAWLVTIARNLVADHYKSGRYRLEVSTADMVDADRVEAGPEHAVLGWVTTTTVLDAVRRLGPEQQECVVLRFLHGLSVAEAALAMGKSQGAVKALQYRAVRSLARLLPADIR